MKQRKMRRKVNVSVETEEILAYSLPHLLQTHAVIDSNEHA